MKATLYFDGGARPSNPGHAGFAALVWLDGEVDPQICSRYIGIKTNNYAEYMGLVVGIKFAHQLGAKYLEIVSDSKLVINQVNGEWRVKSDDLRPLHKEACQLLLKLFGENWHTKWVRRSDNTDADDYCTKAIYHGMNRNPWTPKKIKDKRPGVVYDSFK